MCNKQVYSKTWSYDTLSKMFEEKTSIELLIQGKIQELKYIVYDLSSDSS